MWASRGRESPAWHALWRFWRVQFGWHVYRHSYVRTPGRWVFQLFLIFDT